MFELVLDTKRGPKQKVGLFNRAVDLAMRDGQKMWQSKILKRHFKPGAKSKYNYKYRSKKHMDRKRRFKGHSLPLVFSGHARDWFTRPSNFYVTGTRKKMIGKFNSPNHVRYFWMTPAGHPNKPKEMKATNNSEDQKIASFIKTRAMEYYHELEKSKG